MKVVLFCGGLGMRLREYSETIPKPMVNIGPRPVLWHVMKYYAHFGHKDFILCLGHGSDFIKNYFLNYNEALSNDFVLSAGNVELLRSDIADWHITFLDTGIQSSVGERLLAARPYLDGEDAFLASYGDTLTDGNVVEGIEAVTNSPIRINGGYFFFRSQIFDYIGENEDLIDEPFARLIERQELVAYPYDGFWAPLDTLKDKHNLEALIQTGQPPWAVWNSGHHAEPDAGSS